MTPYGIAEAAALTGLTATTLRYYERDGLLLGPVHRATSGHRRYTEHDLRWITLLTRLRDTGMPMRDVRAPTSTPSTSRSRCTRTVCAPRGRRLDCRLDLQRAARRGLRP